MSKAPESRQHFDVWQFATADKNDGQQSYFGAVPPQVIENLLWFAQGVANWPHPEPEKKREPRSV